MIQEIESFVDPDLTVEFDPASRVSRHASLKCASLLSFSLLVEPTVLSLLVMFLSYSLRTFSFSLALTVVLVHSTKTKEATGPAWSEKRRAGKEEKKEKGGTNLGAKRNQALPEGQRETWRTE